MAKIPLEIDAKLEPAVQDIKKFRANTERELDKISKATKLISFVELGRAAIDAGKAMANAFGSFIEAANESDAALQALNVSMRTAGDFSESALKSFQDFAKTTQAQTGIEDDLIIKNLALAKSFGFTNDEAVKVNKAAVELAAVTGQDLTSAVETLNASYLGNTKSLAKMFPEIRGFTREQLAAGAAVDYFNSRFAGTAESLGNTYAGALKKSAAAFSDLKETIGGFITGNPQVVKAISTQSSLFSQIEKVLIDNKKVIQDFISGAVILFIKAIEIAIESTSAFVSSLGFLEKIFVSLGGGIAKVNAFLQLFNQATSTEQTKNLSEQLKDIDKTGAEAFNEINKKTKDRLKLTDNLSSLITDYRKNVEAATAADVNQVKITNSKIKLSTERQKQLNEEIKLINEQTAALKKQAIEQAGQTGIGSFFQKAPTLKTSEGKAVDAATQKKFEEERKIAATLGTVSTALQGSAGAVKIISSVVGEFANTILPGIGGVVSQIFEIFAQGPEKVKEFITGFINAIPTIIENINLAIPAVIETLVENVPRVIERLINDIPKVVQALIEKLPHIVVSLATMMPMIATRLAIEMPRVAVEFTAGLIRSIPDIVKGFVDEIGKQFKSFGGLFGGGGGGNIGSDLLSVATFGLFAEGGVVPDGYPNDTYPAALTSGEAVIDRSVSGRLLGFLDKYEQGGTQGGAAQSITINLQVGEKQLADVILQLNRNGFRTA